MLRQTLDSIARQKYPIEKIEVIIVSQTPEIENKLLPHNSSLNIKAVFLPEHETISALRNQGVRHSSGQYLAFLDADIFISNNWITCMLSHLNDTSENRAIVSGSQICEPESSPLEHIRTHLASAETDTNVSFLPGCNLFQSKKTFELTRGFPEYLITCEDYYFTDKASQYGKLYRTSDTGYIHLGEDKVFSQMFKKELWRGQSNLQSIQGRKISLKEIPSFILPLGIYLSLLASVISLLFGASSLAILFFTLGTIPLLAYSIRLYRLTKRSVKFHSVFRFYITYFLARAIGTIVGLFKSIKANHS